jgi:hypothetical protein
LMSSPVSLKLRLKSLISKVKLLVKLTNKRIQSSLRWIKVKMIWSLISKKIDLKSNSMRNFPILSKRLSETLQKRNLLSSFQQTRIKLFQQSLDSLDQKYSRKFSLSLILKTLWKTSFQELVVT